MLHSIDPTILFLQEEDVIKAGALDMRMTLEAVEETYRMFGKGELLNPPKTHIRHSLRNRHNNTQRPRNGPSVLHT